MAGLIVGLAVAVVVMLVLALTGKSRGGRLDRVARCGRGHLFSSTVIPGASLKAVRLGSARLQRCPVGHHWGLVRWVDESTLTAEQLAAARSVHDVHIP